ncbi:DEHA2F10604p [Debaryomyces hansenii CBS767]|uniref:DEHA2F10604p n=1 Tax=Debaryomyces hansenii (strain ATCC 36239 / CBS 767 / BCRC 21394 / JCM 1990 / NBRC 0083 / IGC 2968) TaxID=284592 RepID=B5RUD8_DEBHA|nr:DEHA2F10604p [Debaryomyces hansenii CBS767]CAR66316.1 DEHA2F10604p [Debaryomyces hansenii CBS767]|eukprot:XP_002770791.1 DEHA2F10604p [Debaryomyces hansenii CBS767]
MRGALEHHQSRSRRIIEQTLKCGLSSSKTSVS